ncbi:hypothetical protein [Chengkuizengella sediminis]|uniref:hypothetical protein n=1 Tax=Chengkuizengella sediminis TaxID=1885917 RepID=UPI001389DB2B|nr:hypothetical protein [Chengkuizengella sediminis]NDI33950.1 hypothetical protein [Chengkuizengella sediminis]
MTKSESWIRLGFDFLKRKIIVSAISIIVILAIEFAIYTLYYGESTHALKENLSLITAFQMVFMVVPLIVIAIPISILSDVVTDQIYKDSRKFIAFFLHVMLFTVISLLFANGFPIVMLVVGLTGVLYWMIDEFIRVYLFKMG